MREKKPWSSRTGD